MHVTYSNEVKVKYTLTVVIYYKHVKSEYVKAMLISYSIIAEMVNIKVLLLIPSPT